MRWFAVRPRAGTTLAQLKSTLALSAGVQRINEESDHLNILLAEGADADIVIGLIESLPEVESVVEDTTPTSYGI